MFTLSSACLFLFKDPVSSLHFTGSCCVPVSPRHLRIYPFSSHHHGIRVAHLPPALPGIYGLSLECLTTLSTCSFNKTEFLHLHLLSSFPVTERSDQHGCSEKHRPGRVSVPKHDEDGPAGGEFSPDWTRSASLGSAGDRAHPANSRSSSSHCATHTANPTYNSVD